MEKPSFGLLVIGVVYIASPQLPEVFSWVEVLDGFLRVMFGSYMIHTWYEGLN